MARQKSHKQAGRSLGVRVSIFAGQFFLRGSPRILWGLAPQALAPQKAPQKEPSCTHPSSSKAPTGGDRKMKFSIKNKKIFRNSSLPQPGWPARAGPGHSACRSWRYQCSTMWNCQGNLSMYGTFLIRLLPPPNNRGWQLRHWDYRRIVSKFFLAIQRTLDLGYKKMFVCKVRLCLFPVQEMT